MSTGISSDQHHVGAAIFLLLLVFGAYVWFGGDACDRARRAASPVRAVVVGVEKISAMSGGNNKNLSLEWQEFYLDVAGFFYRVFGGKEKCQWIEQGKKVLYEARPKNEDALILEDLERRIVGPRP